MATTACTDNNTTVIIGATGYSSDGGEVITYNTPTPVWTDSNDEVALQCNAVTIGGFNGLNS
jgi:hypothetical protein